MKQTEMQEKIARFSGNIQTAFKFLNELNKYFQFDLDFNFESTNALQKFTNMIRNMISRGLIQKPIKSGRSLILGEIEILQLIVARRYLSAGCSMNNLSGYLLDMDANDLYNRLFSRHLPDIEKIIRDASKREERYDVTHCHAPQPTKSKIVLEKRLDGAAITNKNLFYQIELSDGLSLHIQKEKFKKSVVSKMIKDLQKYL